MLRTLRWGLAILVVLAGVAWWQAGELWSRRHELLTQQIRDRLDAIAPRWKIEFERAELLDDAHVRLIDLRIGVRGEEVGLLWIPELRLELDEDLLSNRLQVLVRRAEARSPVLLISRSADGAWNWEDLPPIPESGAPAPEVLVHHGAVHVRLAARDTAPEIDFELQEIDVELHSASFQNYEMRGRSAVDTAGALEFTGRLDLRTLTWSVQGHCAELQSPGGLLSLAASLSEGAREKLQELASRTAAARAESPAELASGAPQTGTPVRPARMARSESPPAGACAIPALGVSAHLEVAFQLSGDATGAPVQYQVGLRVKNGEIDNPALPVPLNHLQGEVFVDNSQVVLKEVQASNGDSRLFLDGRISRDPQAPHQSFVLQAQNLEFGREIEQHLWGGLLRLYQQLRPAGRFNIDVTAETDGWSGWKVNLNRFEAYDSSLLPVMFPYPVQGATGRIWQEGERFLIDFQGFAGDRPVTARGEFRNPGPHVSVDVAVQTRDLPINDALDRALEVPALRHAHAAIESMRLSGLADVDVRIIKTGLPNDPMHVGLDARVHDGALSYIQFPYAITDFSGRIRHDPLAANPALRRVWTLTDLQGRHGPAQLTGQGSVTLQGGQPLVDLQLSVLQAPIDRDLELACVTAAPPLQDAFDSLGRTGTLDAEEVRVVWSPPGKPIVSLPKIIVQDAALRLECWPYSWERVNGSLGWDRDRLTIASLSGWHGGETYLQIDNHGEPNANVLEFPATGDIGWHVHLEDVRVRKLAPDSALRSALAAAGMSSVIDALDPRGLLDINLGIDLKGHRHRPDLVTAAWEVEVDLRGNSLSPGVKLTNVVGRVEVHRGIWDGRRAVVDGHFRLERATALGLPLSSIEGPFLVDGPDIVVGQPAWPDSSGVPVYDANNPLGGKQARADVYGGKLGFDVHVRLSPQDREQTTYRASIMLRDALLEGWARDHGLAAERLKGPINGRLDLVGQGTSDRTIRGNGWVQISPAQLYELPVLNRVLSSVELRQPDTTAFRFADGEFTLHDGLVDFSKIDLVGESLRLVGRGTVAFGAGMNQRLAIDFFRSKFRNRIPIAGQLISLATANSIGVEVRGTLSNPAVNVQPKLGVIDDTLRGLLESFNAGQMPGLPRAVPQMGPPPGRPLAP